MRLALVSGHRVGCGHPVLGSELHRSSTKTPSPKRAQGNLGTLDCVTGRNLQEQERLTHPRQSLLRRNPPGASTAQDTSAFLLSCSAHGGAGCESPWRTVFKSALPGLRPASSMCWCSLAKGEHPAQAAAFPNVGGPTSGEQPRTRAEDPGKGACS